MGSEDYYQEGFTDGFKQGLKRVKQKQNQTLPKNVNTF